jgi:hypothetical protein
MSHILADGSVVTPAGACEANMVEVTVPVK